MFSDKLDVKLIRQVKENPVLYDYSHEKYMDFNAREVAWQKIGDELKKPATDCKIRWINIRDVHRRILRKRLSNGSKTCKAYKYENELGFMRHYYKDVAAPAVSCDEQEKGNDWSAMLDGYDDDDNDTHLASHSDDSEKPIKKIKPKRKKSKKRKEVSYEQDEKQASSTFNESAAISGDFDIADPVDAFLLSIGATLKTFSPYHLNVAKTKIFAVVQEHDLQQIVEKERHDQPDVKAPTGEMYIV